MSEQHSSPVLRRFRRSYVLALGAIAILLSGLILLTQQRLSAQQNDAKLINLSGRQRMISQRLTKELLLIESGQSSQRQVVEELLETWKEAHETLRAESRTPAGLTLVEQIDPVLLSIAKSTRSFLESGGNH